MDQAALGGSSPTMRLVLVPALISLVVTLWRLTGELLSWSTVFFNPEAGGRRGDNRHHVVGTDLRDLFRLPPRQERRRAGELGKGDRPRRARLLSSRGGWSGSGVPRSEEFPRWPGVHLVARSDNVRTPISRLAAAFQDTSCLRVGRAASSGPHHGAGYARDVGDTLRRNPPRISGAGLVGELLVANRVDSPLRR